VRSGLVGTLAVTRQVDVGPVIATAVAARFPTARILPTW